MGGLFGGRERCIIDGYNDNAGREGFFLVV